jgi:hypothetical protein
MAILGKSKGRAISKTQFEVLLRRFTIFLKRELQISYDIPVVLIDDAEFSKQTMAFGIISDKNIIYLSIINRHPMDIFRTLAHEYFHYKQHIEGRLGSGKPGSTTENQANAKAGEIIRKYGSQYPELFDLMPVR